jgi:hypothetical protein
VIWCSNNSFRSNWQVRWQFRRDLAVETYKLTDDLRAVWRRAEVFGPFFKKPIRESDLI